MPPAEYLAQFEGIEPGVEWSEEFSSTVHYDELRSSKNHKGEEFYSFILEPKTIFRIHLVMYITVKDGVVQEVKFMDSP